MILAAFNSLIQWLEWRRCQCSALGWPEEVSLCTVNWVDNEALSVAIGARVALIDAFE